ncbi:MAG: hypothetical protein CMJ76_15980 [Planctomycetaceae bacterium]|nr:hypothetical protein [Planctomycetaceae bacterium]|tara:strand:- start:140 stop:1027 length:888 start_codon:yes stop_codon:yes gene_type:complete
MSDKSFTITAFYKFLNIEEAEIASIRSELQRMGYKFKLQGLTLLATEGVNGTVSSSAEGIGQFKQYLQGRFGDISFKDSYSDSRPFKRWLVKIRDEIVAIKDKSIFPDGDRNHLSPQQWHQVLSEEDVVLIDTRNICETDIGMFKGAIDPGLNSFGEFPEWVRECGIPRDKKVLMYCTGGIRCEKALISMEREGYENVYQLKGGILDYLAQYPQGHWEGECFVFDGRVAVDNQLAPSRRYKFCPHCGDPGDLKSECTICDTAMVICQQCSEQPEHNTCSKNCAEKFRRQQVVAGD